MKDQLQTEMKTAMRNKDKPRLETIRSIQATFKQYEVDHRTPVTQEQAWIILDKLAKQRQDSIDQFKQANRQDLVDKETFELSVIREFMPEPFTQAEIDQHIHQALAQTQANSMKDMGKVMGILKPILQGRADLALVSKQIKTQLSS